MVASRAGRLLWGLPVLLALAPAPPVTRVVAWPDLSPAIQARLIAAGVSAAAFPGFLDRLQRTHAQRVREGDLDHLVFYFLQSTHFTRKPSIEPALSARALVEGLDAAQRRAYLQDGRVDLSHVPDDVRARARDLLGALDAPDPDPRLLYFRQLAAAALPRGREREAALLREYLRAMRFLYEKEFVARRNPDPADAVAALYRSRGLSTDTAIEAGYAVHLGLAVLRSLEPARHVRRVLLVGPGLDLAPRTALIDETAPESYQPWTVIDALVGLGLSRLDDLEVVCADINPRVVDHLRRRRAAPPTLTFISGLQQSPQLTIERDYREYFARVGASIASAEARVDDANGRLRKQIRVDSGAGRALSAVSLDIVTQRLQAGSFDVTIATNILPYFDDVELALAMSNMASMMAPGGILLHNEPRPALREIATALGLPMEQSRQVPIARVAGAPPLADTIWLHRSRVNEPGRGRD